MRDNNPERDEWYLGIRSIREVLETSNLDEDFVQSLVRRIAKWSKLVYEISDGYIGMVIYDYTNDLAIRESIEIMIREIDDDICANIRSIIGRWDQVFIENTLPGDKPLEYYRPKIPGLFIWTRVPSGNDFPDD